MSGGFGFDLSNLIFWIGILGVALVVILFVVNRSRRDTPITDDGPRAESRDDLVLA